MVEESSVRERAGGDTPVELSTKLHAPQLSPESHITALCGQPRFHHTLRHPANRSSV